jgi:hypothetical protein
VLGLVLGAVLGEALGDALGIVLGDVLGDVLALGAVLGKALGYSLCAELGEVLGAVIRKDSTTTSYLGFTLCPGFSKSRTRALRFAQAFPSRGQVAYSMRRWAKMTTDDPYGYMAVCDGSLWKIFILFSSRGYFNSLHHAHFSVLWAKILQAL